MSAVLLPDPAHVLAAFLPSVTRKVRKQGIRYLNRWYCAHGPLEKLIGTRVCIKYHPAKLDSIWVCLNGITPSIRLPMIGTHGRIRHEDALVDRLPTLAIKAETERQAFVARRLSAARQKLVERLEKTRCSGSKAKLPSREADRYSLGGRPEPSLPGNSRKW